MRKLMKTILLAFAMIAAGHAANAQAPNLDSVKQELYKINKVFDSASFLGFDVDIKYTSDTVYGRYDYEEMKGSYLLNSRNIYYKMGNIEYVQNDSFAYTLYHDEQMLSMSRDSVGAASSLFPLKEFTDSVLNWYASFYTIQLRDEDDSRVIEFTATDSTVPYKRIAIYYLQENHFPDKLEMFFTEDTADYDPTSVDDNFRPTRKYITMSFSNYHHPVTTDVFDDANYIFYDRSRKQYRPSEKYRNYQFMAYGVNEEGDDDTVEVHE